KQDITLSPEQYIKARKEGFLFILDDKIKEPGTFLMRAVVRDTVSGRIGSASQFVQIPDTRKGQLAISGILMQTAHPGALTPAPHQSAEADGNGKVEEWAEGGPAVRRYRPGLNVLYGFEVINPKVKGAHMTSILAQVRVFRNGHLLYTGKLDHTVIP